ncbi:hypothetical protein GCM10023187_43320 [Nibrella viscosa]|uniref:Uncharacterized protein n=1 Tax=Nibrella viscosa TaxID=1084524 RepID=A0ABP8KRB3_9BACT
MMVMNFLTTEQLTALAQTWKVSAYSLHQYQARCWDTLTLEQHLDINAYQSSLLNRAHDLETGTAKIGFEDNVQAIQTISLVAIEAQKLLQSTNTIPIGLNIGAVLVTLAAATARRNTSAMQHALRELDDLAGVHP